MSKHYQLRRSGYTLPHNLYMQVKYLVRDYSQMRGEREALSIRDKAEEDRIAALDTRISAIEEAADHVGGAYGLCVHRDDEAAFDALRAFDEETGLAYFRYVLYDPIKDKEPSYMTWRRCRQMLVFLVAKNLKLI